MQSHIPVQKAQELIRYIVLRAMPDVYKRQGRDYEKKNDSTFSVHFYSGGFIRMW